MIKQTLIAFALVGSALADGSLGCYSSIDTSKGTYYQYQSPSYCANQCPDSPYVAIKAGGTCYCLSSLPTGSQADTCNIVCNGYGSMMCGGTNSYSVFKGIGSDDSSASASNSQSSPSSTGSSSPSSATSKSSPHSSTTSSSGSGTTDAPTDASGTDSQTVVTRTESVGDSVIFRTVTSSPTSTSGSSSSSSSSSEPNKKTSNVGPIVGGVVGGIAGVVLICLGIFLFMRFRRYDEDDDEEDYFDKPPGAAPSLGRGNTAKGSRRNKPSPLDMPMSNPFVHPSDATASSMSGTHAGSGIGSLSSNGGLVDPRLNPVMMGRRRLSEGSLADEADYSRKILQVANP